MYRILLFNKSNNYSNIDQSIIWFEGDFNLNEIPYPILFNKEKSLYSENKELILSKGQYYIDLSINEILRIESNELGSIVFMANNGYWTTRKQIDSFELSLNQLNFFRVHKNHLINILYFESLIKCDAFIKLKNSDAIPVEFNINKEIMSYLETKHIT